VLKATDERGSTQIKQKARMLDEESLDRKIRLRKTSLLAESEIQ
jgi:hypothetical protein